MLNNESDKNNDNYYNILLIKQIYFNLFKKLCMKIIKYVSFVTLALYVEFTYMYTWHRCPH